METFGKVKGMTILGIFLTLSSFLFLTFVTHGFGSLADCPAQSPCLCNGVVIQCEVHKLPNIPVFRYVGNHFTILRLGVNNITHIPRSAFASLNVTEIHLDFNYITSIDVDAFRGMETQLKVIDLSHNRLTTVPEALGTLAHISELDMSYNAIDGYQKTGPHTYTDGFTDLVMRNIGDSLNKFTFGDDFLLNWPRSLHHLVQLKEMYLAGSTINFLLAGEFHGFEHTVTNLTIAHSSFWQLPLAIGQLDRLEELHFDNNRIDDGDSVIIKSPLLAINKTLKVLTLRYDRLKLVPEVLKDLRMLTHISLDGNQFAFISDEAISFIKHTQVRMLSFRDCGLTRLPGSLSDLHNLIELDFSKNQIKTVESTDLRNIPSLTTLTLARNPLKYISRDSFIGLRGVELLDMSHSNITEIPESIANLDSLKVLDVSHSRIDCTCELSWVRRLIDYVNITIKGECETIESNIQVYVLNRVPNCLDYRNYFSSPLG